MLFECEGYHCDLLWISPCHFIESAYGKEPAKTTAIWVRKTVMVASNA
jgi:hypothetical protein